MRRNFPSLRAVFAVLGAGSAMVLISAGTALAAPPANDNFANSIQIGPAAPDTENGTNVEATLEPNEDQGIADDNTVWYHWAPAANQTVFLHTCTSNFDTTLDVFTGNAVNNLTLLESNDDAFCSPNGLGSSVQLAGEAGTTYRIAVGSFDGAEEGTFTLSLGPPPPFPLPDPPSTPPVTPVTPTVTPAPVKKCKKGQKLKKGKCVKKKRKKK
jgi:hypothetical protein